MWALHRADETTQIKPAWILYWLQPGFRDLRSYAYPDGVSMGYGYDYAFMQEVADWCNAHLNNVEWTDVRFALLRLAHVFYSYNWELLYRDLLANESWEGFLIYLALLK